MEYIIITEQAPNAFMKAVNDKITEGWQLQGGVSVTLTGPRQEGTWTAQSFVLAQALVR
jgi:hypothetical protein